MTMRMLEYDLISSQLFKSLYFIKLQGTHTIINNPKFLKGIFNVGLLVVFERLLIIVIH